MSVLKGGLRTYARLLAAGVMSLFVCISIMATARLAHVPVLAEALALVCADGRTTGAG